MTQVLVRNAESTDYQPVIAVIDDWWGGRHMADMLPKLFFVHFRPTSFVAEDADSIVGFLIGFVSQTFPDEAYIHFVGIHPERRAEGLGRALYERFFAAAAELGCRKVQCVTSPVNTDSVAFHRRMGFSIQESERRVNGFPVAVGYDGKGEDRVRFCRRLDRECSSGGDA